MVIHSSQQLREADGQALSNRILAVLPKASMDRRDALLAIRKALGEPDLFMNEPEFIVGGEVT